MPFVELGLFCLISQQDPAAVAWLWPSASLVVAAWVGACRASTGRIASSMAEMRIREVESFILIAWFLTEVDERAGLQTPHGATQRPSRRRVNGKFDSEAPSGQSGSELG